MMDARRWRVALGALLVALARPAAAQLQLPEGVTVRLSAQLQTQFNTTSVDSANGAAVPGSEFVIRRARLTFDMKVGDFFSARLEPDYNLYSSSSGSGVFFLRDAWVRATFSPALRATLGQFKRPFDLFQLTASSQLLVIERTGAIRGVAACGALQAVCSFSTLTAGLLYADRDIGVMLDGEVVDGRVHYAAALTNGRSPNQRENNSNKSYTGRVSVSPVKDVLVAVNAAYKDYAHPTSGAQTFATAWGADVEIGNFNRGLHVQAGLVSGDDWLLAAGPQDVARFLTLQAIVTYKTPVRHKRIASIEPVARASWADPDTHAVGDDGWLFTPGLNVYLGGRNMLLTDFDVWAPRVGTTQYSFKTQWNFYF
jgi:hypothetical protein